jgi:predicted nucleic acid-binding protein
MTRFFADTSSFVDYLNGRDRLHELAVHYMTGTVDRILSSQWVLAELGNFLSGGLSRRLFGPLLRELEAEERVTILPAERAMFRRASELYVRRPDKEWSFTDCSSFVIMHDHRLREALTTDHHFEQAGFTALLK